MKRKTKRANTVVSDRSKRLAIRVEIFRIFQVFLFLSFFFIWKNKAGQPKRTNNNTLFSVQEDDALLSQVFCKVSMMKLFTRLGDGGFMVKVVALFFSRAGSFVLTGEEATVYHVCTLCATNLQRRAKLDTHQWNLDANNVSLSVYTSSTKCFSLLERVS